jgi:hypothetical protein
VNTRGKSRSRSPPDAATSSGSISMTWPQYLRGECCCQGSVIHMRRVWIDIVAMLLLRRGEVVTLEELSCAAWPDRNKSPQGERSIMRGHLSGIRKLMPDILLNRGDRGWEIPLPRTGTARSRGRPNKSAGVRGRKVRAYANRASAEPALGRGRLTLG